MEPSSSSRISSQTSKRKSPTAEPRSVGLERESTSEQVYRETGDRANSALHEQPASRPTFRIQINATEDRKVGLWRGRACPAPGRRPRPWQDSFCAICA